MVDGVSKVARFVFTRPVGDLKVYDGDGNLRFAVEASGAAGAPGPILPGHYRLFGVTSFVPPRADVGPARIGVCDLRPHIVAALTAAGLAANSNRTTTVSNERFPHLIASGLDLPYGMLRGSHRRNIS